MSRPPFTGAITALVTPFRAGRVDEAAFRALVERQVSAGVAGLVPVGTTGETATLDAGEHRRVVELCVEACARRVPVIAGAGANSTATAIELARHAKAAGADGALVVTPYYNRPSQEGLYRHYATVAEAVDLPLVLYNVPSRTGVDLATDTVIRLAALPNVVGLKDATGDLARVSLMRLACPEGFALLSGDDPSALGYVAQGGHGVISVTSNVAPEPCAQRIRCALEGDFAGALAVQDRLIGLDRALFADNSPAPAKWALARLGLCTDEVRLPLAPCSEAAQAQVREAMAAAGLG
ncbi:MAG: 4-hydroxy-tetrahydrodipicolinate synthase [Caulobacteraceae bacterium]|nr:4-hydroxy-tetrahydrodipicolinate synthase [Caulobacter sp.]